MATVNTAASAQQPDDLRWSVLLLEVPVGLIFVIFNFHGFMRFQAQNYLASYSHVIAEWVIRLSHIPQSLYALLQQSEGGVFYLLFRFALNGIGVYLLLVFLLSLRAWALSIFFRGVGGILAGILSVPILAWTIYLILGILKILFTIINFLTQLLAAFWAWASPFFPTVFFGALALLGIVIIVSILLALWETSTWGGIIAVILTAIVAYLWGRPILLFLLTKILWPIFSVLRTIFSFLAGILSFLGNILIFIFSFLVKVVLFLFVVVSGIGLLALLGHLLIDQYKAAWKSGKGRKSVLAGSFAIGLAASLVFLNCYGHIDQTAIVNDAWATVVTFASQISPMTIYEFLFPPAYREAIQLIFSPLSYPVFDSFVLATVLVFSCLGVIRGLFSMDTDDVQVTFIGREAGILVFGVVIGVAFLLLQAFLPQED